MVIKKSIDSKAKMARHPNFVVRKSDACWLHGYKPIKGDSEDKKDFEVKKTPNTFINNNSSSSG